MRMRKRYGAIVGVLAASILGAGSLFYLGGGLARAQAAPDQHGSMSHHGPMGQHGTMGQHGQMGQDGAMSQMGQHGRMGQHGPMRQTEPGGHGPMGPGSSQGMPMDMARHFIEEMIPHHEDAVVMADLALNQAEHPELRELAEAIKRVQTEEIEQMRQWYQQWYGSAVPASSMSHAMPGMADHDARAIDGAQPFDKAFIEDMIPHHQMAVMMSTMAQRGVEQPELKALLASIRASQAAEIEQMRGWYQAWYGTPVPSNAMSEHPMMGR
jgi:uncharacterized protein (DUF305 family)